MKIARWGIGSIVQLGLVVPFLLLVDGGSATTEDDGVRLRHLKFAKGGAVGRSFRLSEIGAKLRWPTKVEEQDGKEGPKAMAARVIAGNEVGDSGFFPEVVAIATYDSETQEVDPYCTGSLLDEKIVLTAAHCIYFAEVVRGGPGPLKSLFVCGGTTNLDTFGDATCAVAIDGYTHNYSFSRPRGQDIAVLGLAASLKVEGTRPGRISFEKPQAGTLVYAVGYGINTHSGDIDGLMRYGDALFVPGDLCEGAAVMGIAGDRDIVCMNGNYDGSGGSICRGDSGSPMVVRDSNNPENNYIIGVASMKLSPAKKSMICDWRTEGIYMGLHSDSHREFIQAAVENLGGTLQVVGEDAAGLSCEGREQLCEDLPGDRKCLARKGGGVVKENCCRNSGRKISCLKAVIAGCADNEQLAEAVKVDEEKFEDQCLPKYGCGQDDVDRCLHGLNDFFERQRDPNEYIFGTFCESFARANICIGLLLERCEGNEIVLEAKAGLDVKFAEEGCDQWVCDSQHITGCSRFIDESHCRTIILHSPMEWSCCYGLTRSKDCLLGIKYSCSAEKAEATEGKLKELDFLRENGECGWRGQTGECDVGFCTSSFEETCQESDVSRLFYMEKAGAFARLCCRKARVVKLCLEKRIEECEENREELETEHARVSRLFPAESCQVVECSVSQCLDIERTPRKTSRACGDFFHYRKCLRNLADRCEEDRETIEPVLQQVQDLFQQNKCAETCEEKRDRCLLSISKCESLEESLRDGNMEYCCSKAAWERKCLLNAMMECPNNSSIEQSIQRIEENFPEEQCLTYECTAEYCTEYEWSDQCQGGISELESWSHQSLCCAEAERITRCLQNRILNYCAERPEQLEEAIDLLAELYPEDQCIAIECRGNDCEPSVYCMKSIFSPNDENATWTCCNDASNSRACLRDRIEKCGDDADAVASLNTLLVKWDEQISVKCDRTFCSDEDCLSRIDSNACSGSTASSLGFTFYGGHDYEDSFYEDYWKNVVIDGKNVTKAFLEVECCESVADARKCLQFQLEICPKENQDQIKQHITELEAEHPEQQCQDLFCSADHCGFYLESNTNCNASPLNSECCETANHARKCLARSSFHCAQDEAALEKSLEELNTSYPDEACGCILSQQQCLHPLEDLCLEPTWIDRDIDDSPFYDVYSEGKRPTLEQCCSRAEIVQWCFEGLLTTCPESVSGDIEQKLDEVKEFTNVQCCETRESKCLTRLRKMESLCPGPNRPKECCASWLHTFECLQILKSQTDCAENSSAEVDEGIEQAREYLANCEEIVGVFTRPSRSRSPACFPGKATVELENGSVKSMMELEAGDRVLVGDGLYSDVIGFTHRMENEASDFVTLHTAGGGKLSLSPSHFTIVSTGSARILVPAREVRPGSLVLDGHGKELLVIQVSRTRLSGLYNPHTLGGKIVVNGVMVSTYTEAVHPSLAHLLLMIVRMLYRLGIKEPLGSIFYGTVLRPFWVRVAVRISALAG